MKNPISAHALLFPLLLAVLVPARADTINGTGWKGTASANWSNTGNWDSAAPNTSGTGDRNLFFGQGYANAGGTGSLTANNDLTGWHGYRITFQDIGSDSSGANDKSFTITGNSFTAFDFGGNFPRIENDSFVLQTFNLTSGQTLGIDGNNGGQTGEINPVNGDILISAGTKVDMGDITQLRIFGNNGHTVTFNGPISSSGNTNLNSVSINQNSTVVFGATNTYGGDTFVNAGTLRCATNNAVNSSTFVRLGDTSGAIGANFNLDGGLVLNAKFNVRAGSSGGKIIANTSTTTGNATFAGNIFLDDNVTLFANTGGGNTLSGTLFDLKNQTLTISGSGSNTISAALTNSTGSGKVAINATGITTLSGANTYTGNTTLSAGTLFVNGTGAGATLTNSGGIFAGTGVVSSVTAILSGGTLQPGLGNDTATLTISNTLLLAGKANFNLNRANAQNANKISGLTSVAYGGTLTVTNLGAALQSGDTFTLFSSPAYTGGFTSIVLPSLTAGLVWNTNNLAVNGSLSVAALPAVNVTAATTNVTYGASITFTANATGSGTLTYQWYDNHTNAISNATNATLSLASPAVAASGTYTVIVGNPFGTATNTATLTVAPAALGITANNDSKIYGQTKTYGSGSIAFTPSGLQNGETVGSVTITAAGGTATSSPIGAYGLMPGAATGGTFNTANYSITYNAGTLTVNPLAVVLSGMRAYDGTSNAVAAILAVANALGGDNVTVASGTATLADAVPGTQAIVSLGTLALGGTTSSNYTLVGASGSVVITQAATALALSSSANPSGYLAGVAFTANVTPTNATGTVVFVNGVTPFSTNTLVLGSAISATLASLPRGTNTISAIYSGDSNYLGSGNTLSQIVTNHPPVANNAGYFRGAVASWKIKLTDLVTNATDVDGDPLTVTAFGASTNGITLTTNSGYVFYVNTNLVDDQFTYTVSDGFGDSATASVSLTAQAFTTGQSATITVGGSSATVGFAGIPGLSYTVQRSTNLVDWTGIATTNAPSGGLFNVTDTFTDLGGVPGSAYYRLQYNP